MIQHAWGEAFQPDLFFISVLYMHEAMIYCLKKQKPILIQTYLYSEKLQVINGFQQIHCSGSVHKSSCPRRGKQDLFWGLVDFSSSQKQKRHLTCSCSPTFKSFDPKVSGDPLSPFASLCELEITSFILLEVCSLTLIPFRGHLAHGNFQRQLVSGSCAWGHWGWRVRW